MKQLKKNKKKTNITKFQNQQLLQAAAVTKEELFSQLESNTSGLRNDEIEKRIEINGINSIASKNKNTWYKILFESYFSIFSIILIIIAILNVVIPGHENWTSFGIIMAMVLIAGTLKFFQETKSNKASKKLNQLISNTTAIEREGIKKEMPMTDVVIGDIIHLAAGDMIPADMRILTCKDLFITQSSLTGESEPVEKTSNEFLVDKNTMALECSNLCFMGTTVASGSAKGIVIQTGKKTYLGTIANLISKKRPKTSFDKGIKKVSWLLIQVMVLMVLIVFLINGFKPSINDSNPWIESLIFGLSIAVGLTPEMLPMIVTLNLSKDAIKFSKQSTIVKNINSIQTFGAMDILCTDKTGTLTEDKIILQQHLNVDGKQDNRVLSYGFLNSHYQTGLKNLLDVAIIERAKEIGLNDILDQFVKIDEIPFDFTRRRMSIILRDKSNQTELITKGAVEEILSICKWVEVKGQTVLLTNEIIVRIKKTVNDLNSNGMRVIAIARNKDQLTTQRSFCVDDENNMVLIGYIALLDPPKMSAKKAIQALHNKGVEIKILTGDNEKVTQYICSQLEIKVKAVLTGGDVEQLSDAQLKDAARETTIFAKLSPEQKSRVVLALKSNKHIVGFMGDGINDAPAMKAADLAISVDTAVDIAKESADIILLEKDLMILEQGVIQGRKTYANIVKYIKITVSSNFGNMLSMLIASIWLPFLPLQAIQILLLNLAYDFSQLAMSWDNVDEQFLEHPQNWDAWSILKFVLWMGPVSTIFDIATFAVLYYGFGLNDGNNEKMVAAFNTGWFIECALTQCLIVYILRTPKIPFVQSNAATGVTISTCCLLVVCFSLPYIPTLNSALLFDPALLNPWFYLYLVAVVFVYSGLAQLFKMGYVRFNHNWL